jgi:hypothetical protein
MTRLTSRLNYRHSKEAQSLNAASLSDCLRYKTGLKSAIVSSSDAENIIEDADEHSMDIVVTEPPTTSCVAGGFVVRRYRNATGGRPCALSST